MDTKRSGNWLAAGAVLMALAVALGAFGAHGLKQTLEQDMLSVFETAVKYHFYHAIGLLVAGLLMRMMPFNAHIRKSAVAFFVGILIFSGSLYLIATSSIHGFGFVKHIGWMTPFGGLAFILGWLFLAYGVKNTAIKHHP